MRLSEYVKFSFDLERSRVSYLPKSMSTIRTSSNPEDAQMSCRPSHRSLIQLLGYTSDITLFKFRVCTFVSGRWSIYHRSMTQLWKRWSKTTTSKLPSRHRGVCCGVCITQSPSGSYRFAVTLNNISVREKYRDNYSLVLVQLTLINVGLNRMSSYCT